MTVRTRAAVRTASSAALALAALGALAGCAAGEGTASGGAASGGAASSSDSSSNGPSASASTDAAGSAAAGATGTFTETGEYQTPGGRESVEVTLGVTDGTVESVEMTGSGGSSNSQRYQGQFIAGIEAEVVGQSLDTLEVGAVSGSSLTGQGFNAAVEKIRADAA